MNRIIDSPKPPARTTIPAKSIRDNSNGTTTAFVYPKHGKRYQRTFATRRLAEDWWMHQHLRKQKAKIYGDGEDNHVLITDIIDYYKEKVQKSLNSIKRDSFIWPRLLAWFERNRTHYTDQINKKLLSEYELFRRKQGVSQRTVNIDLDLLNAALNCAWKFDRIKYNPMGKYPFQSDASHMKRFHTAKEIEAILQSADSYGMFDIFYTILTLGLRNEEACCLQFKDISNNVICLTQKRVWDIVDDKKVEHKWKPKWFEKRGPRWVYLDMHYANDPYLRKILHGGRPEQYCFPHPDFKDGRPLNKDKLYRRFVQIVRDARIIEDGQKEQIRDFKDINVHTLRHNHVSYAIARVGRDPNITLPIIMDNVGINDYQTLRRYTQTVRNLYDNLPDAKGFPWQKDGLKRLQ